MLYKVESISHHFIEDLFFMTRYRLPRPLAHSLFASRRAM
jgi:hypothetical protein